MDLTRTFLDLLDLVGRTPNALAAGVVVCLLLLALVMMLRPERATHSRRRLPPLPLQRAGRAQDGIAMTGGTSRPPAPAVSIVSTGQNRSSLPAPPPGMRPLAIELHRVRSHLSVLADLARPISVDDTPRLCIDRTVLEPFLKARTVEGTGDDVRHLVDACRRYQEAVQALPDLIAHRPLDIDWTLFLHAMLSELDLMLAAVEPADARSAPPSDLRSRMQTQEGRTLP